MRRNWTRHSGVVLCVLILAMSACGSDGEEVVYGHSVMHEHVLNAVFVGTVVDSGQNLVRVNEILWERLEFYSTRGAVYKLVPLPIGGEVPVAGGLSKLEEGADYTFVVIQLYGTEPPRWSADTAYDSEMHEMLGEVGPPLNVILNADDSSAAAKREALVEYVMEGTAWNDALIAGESNPPAGPRVALALAYTEPTVASEAVDWELGMTVSDYLALDAQDRQLLDLADMPAEVVSAFDLVSAGFLVIFPPELADSYWGFGIRTSVGTLGPFRYSSDQELIPIMGAVPRHGEVELVGWAQPRSSAGVSMRDVVSLGGFDASATKVDMSQVGISQAGDDQVVVFDLTDRSVRVVDHNTADGLVAQHTRPAGVSDGGGG
ncbi:MAG: hypothetical protein JW785_06105 [Acidimicrobiia bacterium]|nr:hypothetical protein [Acidimicrobiia bacterium]